MIVYEWRMRRVPYLEASLINDSLDEIEQRRITTIGGERPHKTLASMTNNAIDVLEQLARYQASLRNGFDKTLQQLWFVQERRRNQELQKRTIEVTSSSPQATSACLRALTKYSRMGAPYDSHSQVNAVARARLLPQAGDLVSCDH